MSTKYIAITVIAILIVGAGGFFGGMKYQQSRVSSQFRQFVAGRGAPGQNGQQPLQGARAGFGAMVGEVIGKGDNSITVKLQDGSSKIVLFSDSTIFTKTADVTKDDVNVGDKVGVFGNNNSDGSIIGENIQLNPQFRNFGQGAQ